jgi:hypothetical protein
MFQVPARHPTPTRHTVTVEHTTNAPVAATYEALLPLLIPLPPTTFIDTGKPTREDLVVPLGGSSNRIADGGHGHASTSSSSSLLLCLIKQDLKSSTWQVS